MIELHQFPRSKDGYNLSPFCLKVQAYLTWTDLPYREVVDTYFKAPKGKLPYIVDNGTAVADSTAIIEFLKKKYGDLLDAHLNAEQHGVGLAVQRMLEEHLSFAMLYSRWFTDKNWNVLERHFFGGLPFILRLIIPHRIRARMKKTLYLQGIARHSLVEIEAHAIADLQALTAILGEAKYLLGDRLTSYDACVYAFLDNVFNPYFESQMRTFASEQPALVNYYQRLRELTPIPGTARSV